MYIHTGSVGLTHCLDSRGNKVSQIQALRVIFVLFLLVSGQGLKPQAIKRYRSLQRYQLQGGSIRVKASGQMALIAGLGSK